MKVPALLVVLAGCNQLLGLNGTRTIDAPLPADARYFDAPADAPYACPPPGTVPTFSPQFTQLLAGQACDNYSESRGAGLVLAVCAETGPVSASRVEQGAIDARGALVSDALLPVTFDHVIASATTPVALSPEGDELWQTDPNTNTTIHVYAHDAGPNWSFAYDITTSLGIDNGISTPMRKGTSRRAVYVSGTTLYELEESAPGAWSQRSTTPLTLSVISPVQLSPDGLRVVFVGYDRLRQGAPILVYYADRADLSSPFGMPTRLDGAPSGATSPFLADDCSRLYFSGLSSVLYLTQ